MSEMLWWQKSIVTMVGLGVVLLTEIFLRGVSPNWLCSVLDIVGVTIAAEGPGLPLITKTVTTFLNVASVFKNKDQK